MDRKKSSARKTSKNPQLVSSQLAPDTENSSHKRKIQIFLIYMNNISDSSQIIVSSGDKDQTKMEIISDLLPNDLRSKFKRTYKPGDYYPELYKGEILVSNKGQEIHFCNKTQHDVRTYVYPSRMSLYPGVDEERAVYFCFGTKFKRSEENLFYKDPPFAPVDDSFIELYLYFAGIVGKSNFDDNLVQLFEDFANYTPIEKRDTNFTEKMLKIVNLSLKFEPFQLQKASLLLLLQLVNVEILSNPAKDNLRKEFHELTSNIIQNHEEMGKFNSEELNEYFYQGMSKFLAMLVLNFPEELDKLPKDLIVPFTQDIFKIISEFPKANLANYVKEEILRIFAYASKDWKEDSQELKAKLYFFIAQQAETLAFILSLKDLFLPEIFQATFQNPEIIETIPRKLIEESKGDIIHASVLADQNFANLFSPESLLSIQNKLFFRCRTLLEIEFFFTRIVAGSEGAVLQWFLQTANDLIPSVLEKMPLLGILTESIQTKNVTKFAHDLIYKEILKKLREVTILFDFRQLADKFVTIFPNYPVLVEEVFKCIFKLTKTKLDIVDKLFPILNAYHHVIVSENPEYWPKGIEQSLLHPILHKIMEFTQTYTETLTNFEKFIESTLGIEKMKVLLCLKFWGLFGKKYGDESFFTNFKNVGSSDSILLKATYRDLVLEKTEKKLKAEALEKIFTQIFGNGSKKVSLETPFSDEIISKLTERLEVPENIFDSLSKIDENHAWIWIISFQRGKMLKKATKYLRIQDLLKDLITRLTSFQVTFDEAKILLAIQEYRFTEIQKNLLFDLDPEQKCLASYQIIKTQSNKFQDVLKKLAGLFKSYLSLATNFAEMNTSFKAFTSNVPSMILKDYKLPQEFQVYQTLAEEVDKIGSSANFKKMYNLNIKKNVQYTCEQLTENLNTAVGGIKDIKNRLEGKEPPTVEYIEKLFMWLGKLEIKQESEILENYLKLKKETVASIKEILTINEQKMLLGQNAIVLKTLAEIFKLQADKMMTVLNENSKLLFSNGISSTQMTQVFHQMRALASKYFDNDDLMEFLRVFVDIKELYAFVIEKDENDIRAMIEMLDDFGSSLIKTTDVAYLLDLLLLFKWFKDQKRGEMKAFLDDIVAKLKEPRYKGILEKVKICNHHLCTFSQLTNKGEASKSIVRNLANGGIVEFFLKHKTYSAQLKAPTREKSIDIREAIEIRDRLHLTLKSAETKIFIEEEGDNEERKKLEGVNDERDLKIFQNFINVIDCIEAIVISLRGLYGKGSYEIEESYKFEFDLETLDAVRKKIEEKERLWNDTIETAYTKYHALTYLYGRQFVKLSRFLTNKDQNREALYLLKFIFGNKASFSELDKIDLGISQLDHLGNHLQKKYTALLNSIQKKPRKLDYKTQTKLVIPTLSDKLFETACTISLERADSLPDARNCLNCSKETCSEEIHAFLKRFIHCPSKELFLILCVEELIEDVQDLLIKLLAKYLDLYDTEEQIVAEIAFITCRSDATIISELLNLGLAQYNQKCYDQEKLMKRLQDLTHSVEVVTSSESGYGKSQFVKDKKGKQIHFPITGSVSRNQIAERLVELEIDNKSILHFDIGNLSEERYREMNEILFSILVLGGLTTFENVFKVPMKCRIFVEVQREGIKQMHLLSLFKITKIEKLSQYIMQPEMRIVFTLLHLHNQNKLVTTDLPNLKLETVQITDVDVQNLLTKYFLSQIRNPNFYKINNFLRLAADLLRSFKESLLFSLSMIADILMKPEVKNIVFDAIIDYSREYTVKSVEYTIFSQRDALLKGAVLRQVDLDHFLKEDKARGVVGFQGIKDFSLLFDGDGLCLPVYSDYPKIPQSYRDLLTSQNYTPEDFRKMKDHELIDKLCYITDIKSLHDRQRIDKKCRNYVMTADNFLKMCLIITKSRANIPIIVMGEAGCGKTSLVKFLAKKFLKTHFEKINFHAGVTPDKLKPQLAEIWKAAKGLNAQGKKLWLFLDEINTSDTLGLVSEMLTSNSYEGTKLPNNIQYIAAVNPYVRRANRVDVGLVKKQAHQKTQQLAYTVHPLPESLFNFVWNFDQLNEKDEELYILRMIQCDPLKDRVLEIAAKCIMRSHRFIRDKDGLGSVSLRDIKRFGVVYKWFFQSLLNRKKILQHESSSLSTSSYGWISYYYTLNSHNRYIPERWDENSLKMKAVILALAICYYVRFENNDTRSKYLQAMLQEIKSIGFCGYSSQKDLEDVIEEEQNEYLNRMKHNTDKDLLRGIAFNSALKENVFTMLVCLINRIPLIICGKPGCSKTLSFQLILNNLRGPDSKDTYFKTLPTLIPVTYQGSLQSTSDGILRVFEKAQRVLDDSYGNKDQKVDREIISVVFCDEMGLAELSRNNPLKVLHSLLEYETDGNENNLKKKVAFVGISNWKLDVSKMSRAVFLARPELDEKNLKFTAKSIMESFNSNLAKIEVYLDALAETYSEFIKKQANLIQYSNFHGLRDFYSLIKGFCGLYIQNLNSGIYTPTQIDDALNLAIERNFGGAPYAAAEFKKLLKQKFAAHYSQLKQLPVLDLIRSNFEDSESRYLMLITKGNFGPQIISNHLKHQNKKFVIMVGSKFDQDIDQEEYSARTLSSIINCLEDGTSIIMQGLDNIYPSLYDLFNQNFTIISKKKTCKIALGTTNNSTCTIDEDFRCIILLDEKCLPDQDPPFLNRFEKQIVGWDSILTDARMKPITENVRAWLKRFCESSLMDNEFVLPPYWLIINFTEENIASLVAEYWNPENIEKEVIQRIKREIIKTASVDLIAACCSSKGSSEINELLKIYYEQPHQSLRRFIQALPEGKSKEKISKSIVYTYSTVFEPLDIDNLTDYEEFPIASIYSERDLDKRLKRFIEKDKKLLIIRMKAFEDDKHFELIKFRVERLIEQLDPKINGQKHLIVLIHINRRAVVVRELGYLSMTYIRGWNQITIDSLSEKKYIDLSQLLEMTTEEILKEEKLIKTTQILGELIGDAYLKINFKGPNSQKLNLSEYISQVANIFVKNDKLKELLFNKIYQMISTQKKWLVEIVTNKQLLLCSKDMYDAVRKFFGSLLEYPLLQIIYTLEQRGGMCSLLKLLQPDNYDDDHGFLFGLWHKIFDAMEFKIDLSQQNMQNVLLKSSYTRVPFSFEDLSVCYDKLNRIEFTKEFRDIAMGLLFSNEETKIELLYEKKKLLGRTEKIIEDIAILKRRGEFDNDPKKKLIFRNLLKRDAISIFVLNFLKCDEQFGELISTIMIDITEDEDYLSEYVLGMINFQKIFTTLISLAQTLWKIYPHSQEISGIVAEYGKSKALNTKFTPFEHMLSVLVKNFYPSEKTLAIFGSWKRLNDTVSKVILHAQVISSELTIWTNVSLELKFWRDLLDIWLSVNATNEQIHQGISGIIEVKESTAESDFLYKQDCYLECCKMFEKLYKRANPEGELGQKGKKNNEKIIEEILLLFSDYLLSCFRKVNDDGEKADIVERALSYTYLRPYLAKFLETIVKSDEIEIQLENPSAPFVSGDQILEAIDESLQKGGQDNDILVHLDSLIYNFSVVPHFTKQQVLKAKYLSDLWVKMTSNQDGQDLSLESLTNVAVLRFFTKEYCLRLFETNNVQEKLKIRGQFPAGTADAMETILQNNKFSLTNSLRILALKHLSELYGGLQAAMEFNKKIEWIKLMQKSLSSKNAKVQYAGFCNHLGKEYLAFSQQLKTHISFGLNAEASHQALIESIKQRGGQFDCLEAFYRELYWDFSNENFDGEHIQKWINQNIKSFEQVFGLARTKVLTALLSNFSKKWPLVSLKPAKTAEELQLISVVNHIGIAMISKISNEKNPNVYSSFISKNNSFEGIITQLQKSFLLGVEDPKNHQQIEGLKNLKSILHSGALNGHITAYYKCECGYFYFVGNCGNVVKLEKDILCPQCKKPIGGEASGKPHPGQQRQETPTIEMITRELQEYFANLPAGYLTADLNIAVKQLTHTIRDLKPITYRILSFILHSLFYYVLAINGADPNEMKKFLQLDGVITAEQYLRDCLELHWKTLVQQLDLKEETYVFLHAVIDAFVDSISNAPPFKNALERNQWESKFEATFLTPLLREIAPKVHAYKTTAENALRSMEETKAQDISLLSLINETVDYQKLDFKLFSYLRVMRITEMGSSEGFENAFRRANMETLYPFTNIFLQAKDQMSKISSLKHIIAFTNHIARQLDRMVTQEEAVSKNILEFIRKHDQSDEIEKEFKVFKEAWSKIKDLAVRYKCKKLPPIEFRDSSELVTLLPSDSIEGAGLYICAAFERLAEIQNEILQMIISNKVIKEKYHHLKEFNFPETFVQDATPENLLMGSEMKVELERKIKSSCYTEVAPGRGKNIIYDYKGAEECLMRNFLVGKRKINYERIRMFQFKGELSKDEDTDIVRMVRAEIPQKMLSPIDLAAVSRYLETNNDFQFFDNLYRSLSNLMSRSIRIKMKEEITLTEACRAFRLNALPHDLAKDQYMKDLKICNIVQIFELVEDKGYLMIEDRTHQKFKADLKDAQKVKIDAFLKKIEEQQQINLQVIIAGVKRFIGRYLDETLKESNGLKNYLSYREGLWPPENYYAISDFLNAHFPDEVNLENSVQFVKYALECIKKKQDQVEEENRKKEAKSTGVRERNKQTIQEGRNQTKNRKTIAFDG